MRTNDPLVKLLKAASAAPPSEAPNSLCLPFGFERKVLSASRAAAESFPILLLFRRAFAASVLIALVAAGVHLKRNHTIDAYDLTVNYSIAAVYVQ